METNNILNRISNYIKKYSYNASNNRYFLQKKNTTLSKRKVKQFKFDISTLKKEKSQLKQECKELDEKYKEKQYQLSVIDASIKDSNRQKLIKEVVNLEHQNEKLLKAKSNLLESVNKLEFQKSMLESEILDLEEEKEKLAINANQSISIEYIDNLSDGLEFEQCFAIILKQLGFDNIEVTSSSGDFGIDVLAKDNNNILYGFQCKLYTSPVGNDAVQQAYAGKAHYNCDIAIVVTNNTFTDQAIQQARETQIILWDRKILKSKIKLIKKLASE